jgi:hypothetical protein
MPNLSRSWLDRQLLLVVVGVIALAQLLPEPVPGVSSASAGIDVNDAISMPPCMICTENRE